MQEQAVALWENAKPLIPLDDPVQEMGHTLYKNRQVIRRFSRFPDRNPILGRQSTQAELVRTAAPRTRVPLPRPATAVVLAWPLGPVAAWLRASADPRAPPANLPGRRVAHRVLPRPAGVFASGWPAAHRVEPGQTRVQDPHSPAAGCARGRDHGKLTPGPVLRRQGRSVGAFSMVFSSKSFAVQRVCIRNRDAHGGVCM